LLQYQVKTLCEDAVIQIFSSHNHTCNGQPPSHFAATCSAMCII